MGDMCGHPLPEHTEWPWGATGTEPGRLRPWENGAVMRGAGGLCGPLFALSLLSIFTFLLMKEQCQVNLCQLEKTFLMNEVGKSTLQKYWSQVAPCAQNQVFIAGNFQVCKHRH